MPENNTDYRIIRNRRRRHTAMRIAADGAVEILAPPGVPEEFLTGLLTRCRDDIERLREKSSALQPPPLHFEEGDSFALLGKFHPLHLSRRLRIFDGSRFIIPDGSTEEKSAALIQLYREIAGAYLLRRAEYLENFTGLKAAKWRISSTDARWGSCNCAGTIALSWKLIQCPAEAVDYVIIHELSHLKHLNHSASFWQTVERYCPEYRLRRNELRNFARNLPRL